MTDSYTVAFNECPDEVEIVLPWCYDSDDPEDCPDGSGRLEDGTPDRLSVELSSGFS